MLRGLKDMWVTQDARACAVAALTLVLLDGIWLTQCGAGDAFLAMASRLTDVQPWSGWQLVAFVGCAYLLLVMALCKFAVWKDPYEAVVSGALLGLVIYGVFDATNLCIFGRGYGWELAAADVSWGIFVMGVAALAGALTRARVKH